MAQVLEMCLIVKKEEGGKEGGKKRGRKGWREGGRNSLGEIVMAEPISPGSFL